MEQKGNGDMVKLMGLLVTVIVIGAGAIASYTITSQKADDAYIKAGSTEERVTQLENEMAFFKGTVTVKLDNLEENDKEQMRKLEKIVEFIMDLEMVDK